MWSSLEVEYYILLNINGEKTLRGDVKKKPKKTPNQNPKTNQKTNNNNKKISALLKNERQKKTSSHGKHSTQSIPPCWLQLSQARNAPGSTRLEENILQSH